ncbi:MAG: hypothetical protein JOZ29_13395 [Deltaproteobacteria bacterium]|nr:hypothetical protein [Deltaproteobacteria bacterium]
MFSFATIGVSLTFARSWSYHYKPITPKPSPAASATEASVTQPTPAPAEQLSAARLLKRTIVSSLAPFTQEHTVRSDKAYADLSEYVVRQLSSFDPLDSPEALGVFADLSGYYLGARAEKLYNCLSLRKGKALEPYMEQYLSNGNTECSQELGQSFTKPSDALGGYALCPSGEQQKAHLANLIAEIDSAKKCSDSDLAAAIASPQASSFFRRLF